MITTIVLALSIGAQVPVEKPSQAAKPPAASRKPAEQKPAPKPATQKPAPAKPVPAGPTIAITDASGKIVTPGFIESNTNLGIVEIPLSAEGTADQNSTDPGVSAAFNVMDAFNPRSTAIPVTRVDGITRALVVPGGTGHIVQGQ